MTLLPDILTGYEEMTKSILQQIARDMKQGTFPEKSKDTLLEEAAARIEVLEAALRLIRDDGKNCAGYCRRQADKALRIQELKK